MAATPTPDDLKGAILTLLARRARDATICPSEVARAAYEGDDDGWRTLMEPTRAAARRLAADGHVEITQAGRRVDPARASGPVRIRLRR